MCVSAQSAELQQAVPAAQPLLGRHPGVLPILRATGEVNACLLCCPRNQSASFAAHVKYWRPMQRDPMLSQPDRFLCTPRTEQGLLDDGIAWQTAGNSLLYTAFNQRLGLTANPASEASSPALQPMGWLPTSLSSHSTRSSYASFRGRHSAVPRFPKPAQTSFSIGENAGWWSRARLSVGGVRTGCSKKMLRFCGATTDHFGVAYCGFTAMESGFGSFVGPSVMSKPMSPTVCVSD
ncbi:hypothetical protein LA080_003340 [Diaporthe eres]|nr:hypothetical protein LA080_003340 [Diaporthe eres]